MSTLRQRLRRFVPASLRPRLGKLRRKFVAPRGRVRRAKERLLADAALSARERELLCHVDERIHPNDGMYSGDGVGYFRAGLSAVACIDEVLAAAPPPGVSRILDLPCGYGRELRFLRLRFPGAAVTACDIQPGAVDFCARQFGAAPAYSRPALSEVAFAPGFDLVWCGSLVTHLDAAATAELFHLFARHLNPGGVAVFTTHGDYVHARLRAEGGEFYAMPDDSVHALTDAYAASGHAYQDYPRGLGYFDFHPDKRGYGISLTSPAWINERIERVGGLRPAFFKPRGWADHQDVHAFSKPA